MKPLSRRLLPQKLKYVRGLVAVVVRLLLQRVASALPEVLAHGVHVRAAGPSHLAVLSVLRSSAPRTREAGELLVVEHALHLQLLVAQHHLKIKKKKIIRALAVARPVS